MQPHQERVVIEKKELDDKLTKLKHFCSDAGGIFHTLDLAERRRLEEQYAVMQRYSQILGDRIAAF